MPLCPVGMMCPQVMPRPKTYSNRCEMENGGAEFIHDGPCSNDLSNLIGDTDDNRSGQQCFDLTYNMKLRSRDINTEGQVSKLQLFLSSMGYFNSEPTGYFGILTEKAVRNFQKDYNLIPTGIVGKFTRAAIKKLTCKNDNYVFPEQNNTSQNNSLNKPNQTNLESRIPKSWLIR
jgi:Putative peptidoglycan-binding domain-containing protein